MSKTWHCVDCGTLIWDSFQRCKSCAHKGTLNFQWGNLSSTNPQQGRDQAKRRKPLATCERCGKPALDRHHKDGNTHNNAPENLEGLCRRCHMILDGRMAKMVEGIAKRKTP